MSEFGDKFGDIARGLLSLEVNTIIKANMAATRMPSAPLEALGQVAADYRGWLASRGAGDGPAPNASAPPHGVTAATFQALAAVATDFRADSAAPGDAILAQRIAINSLQLAGIFDDLTKARPDPDELVQLRKIWEIGTEEIALQTVLWIDGDVTNRVLPEYARSDAMHLLAVHSLAVKNAITMWDSLADILKSLFESVWSLVKK